MGLDSTWCLVLHNTIQTKVAGRSVRKGHRGDFAMTALLTEVESETIDCITSRADFSTSIELRLEVVDPDVVFELTKRPISEERAQFALTALRIGVLSLRATAGQLDSASVKETGNRLIADIRELLAARGREITNDIATSLMQYF